MERPHSLSAVAILSLRFSVVAMLPQIFRITCVLAGFCLALCARAALVSGEAHVWETQVIILESSRDYPNAYSEVDCWIELSGPGFARRVYGFWDGDRVFRVRFVATAPGEWTWRTGSNQPEDAGLNSGE